MTTSTETAPEAGAWLQSLARGSEMGASVAAFDWASTSLGPVETWPTELRVAVRTCLSTSFPMLVVWGDELVKIYNDGYRQILGSEKHPAALGASAAEVWPEIWHIIGPMFAEVMATGGTTWDVDQRLVIERNGLPEECFFTYSYSPLFDDDGRVRGVLDIVTETTGAVVGRRRLECLAEVSSALVPRGDVADLCRRALAALARWPDCLRGAELYLRTGERFVGASATGAGAVDEVALPDGQSGPVGSASEGSGVVLPVGGGRGDSLAVLVATLNPERPFDAGYREFLNLLAQLIGASLDSALQHAVEVDEYRSVSEVLQQAMLEPASRMPTAAARYVAAAGNLAVGGDWYDVIELPGDRRALVVGDCVGHGLDAAAAMSQLRAASRAMLFQGLGPGRMLGELSRYSTSVEGALCATAACVVIDRVASTLTYARAGHLPPLVVGPSGHRWLDDVVGPPLGVAAASELPEGRLQIDEGGVVVLCSDGLVERRGELIDVGLERLRSTVADHLQSSASDLVDLLIDGLVGDEADDDVVVVVKRLPAG